VVNTSTGMRRLTPIELERLNMFPDYHTELEGVSATKRAFFMGNALVVGVIERIGKVLAENIS
jgi:DNA (cytosine-5)-methyltransferase 1